MSPKSTKIILSIISIKLIIVLFFAYYFFQSSKIEPEKINIIAPPNNSSIEIKIDSLNNIFIENHLVKHEHIKTTIDSLISQDSSRSKVTLKAHQNSSRNTLVEIAEVVKSHKLMLFVSKY